MIFQDVNNRNLKQNLGCLINEFSVSTQKTAYPCSGIKFFKKINDLTQLKVFVVLTKLK